MEKQERKEGQTKSMGTETTRKATVIMAHPNFRPHALPTDPFPRLLLPFPSPINFPHTNESTPPHNLPDQNIQAAPAQNLHNPYVRIHLPGEPVPHLDRGQGVAAVVGEWEGGVDILCPVDLLVGVTFCKWGGFGGIGM